MTESNQPTPSEVSVDPASDNSAAASTPAPPKRNVMFRNPGFLGCVVLLAVMGVGMRAWMAFGGVNLIKKPVPSKIDTRQFPDKLLMPNYDVVSKQKIEPSMEDALGTKEYLFWQLVDEEIDDPRQPERYVNLFITYYTGKLDQVPHVPEVCYQGSGYETREQGPPIAVTIESNGESLDIPVRVLYVPLNENGLTKIVMYLFNTNGSYATSRNEVRFITGGSEYAYYSKLEISFGREFPPDEEVALEAGKKFLKRILPVLIEHYWPDWDHDANAPVQATTEAANAG